jgi:hypothetical protein
MDSGKIKVEYPPVRQYHGSDAPILLPDLRINSPENRRKLMQQNPDEDYVFIGGTTAFPGVPEPSNYTDDAGPSNVTRRSSAPPPETNHVISDELSSLNFIKRHKAKICCLHRVTINIPPSFGSWWYCSTIIRYRNYHSNNLIKCVSFFLYLKFNHPNFGF